jgi:hypothetical protein
MEFDAIFLLDRVIPEEDLYVYNMHNIVRNTLISAFHSREAGAGRLYYTKKTPRSNTS